MLRACRLIPATLGLLINVDSLGAIETTMNVAAIIIGIDGWERYTLPLIESIQKHEPTCTPLVIDNASKEPYPHTLWPSLAIPVWRTEERLCYSAAINLGKQRLDDWKPYDWYIVLSNDVLCVGPFAHILAEYDDNNIVGPQLWHEHGLDWIVGWCMAIPAKVWDTVGGFDPNFTYSSWDDVDMSHSARRAGFGLIEDTDLPFVHLDQKQRFGLPGYAGSEGINRNYFMRKHGLCN